MTPSLKIPKKLIEVALPLAIINEESARLKRKAPSGYFTTLHRWFAQRPLPAARAILFAQLVNDPGFQQGDGFRYGMNKADAIIERNRLFKIMEELVKWSNTNNERVLEMARIEIQRSWREFCELNKGHPRAKELCNPDRMPPLHDPFAGGGSIPSEGQRLGVETYASDLNPIPVLINRALIEVPRRFKNQSPVNPSDRTKTSGASGFWQGAAGLAQDVVHYGNWMRDEARRRIGQNYPEAEVTAEMARKRPDLKPLVGKKLKVVAWLWARTVKSPSPAFSHVDVPLVSTFVLFKKEGKGAFVEPLMADGSYSFTTKIGVPPSDLLKGTSAGARQGFRCLMSGVPISYNYIRAEGMAGRMGIKLMATIAKGPNGRVYLDPTREMESVGIEVKSDWTPNGEMPKKHRNFQPPAYGLESFSDLYTGRQASAVSTFSDLVCRVRDVVRKDAVSAGLPDDGKSLEVGGSGASAYAEAVSLYLAFAVSRMMDYGSATATWRPKDNAMRASLSLQAIPMTWDFAEGSPFGESSSGFEQCVAVVSKVLGFVSTGVAGHSISSSASENLNGVEFSIISTDPPYYDNVSYADLSDFFYPVLKRSLGEVFPTLFASNVSPKTEELIASPTRHGGEANAESFFLSGMSKVMQRLVRSSHPAFPVTIYYAFKQSETDAEGTSSSGWETFLEAVISSGFSITGTWPVRTEGDNRRNSNNQNALASSVVLVCRKRDENSATTARRDFIRELNSVLPQALEDITLGGGYTAIAPVDLSQAILGPGMAIFSKYSAVLEADGSRMSVKTAIKLINRFFAEDDFDHDTQFCLSWFDEHGWEQGKFGDADVLARAKGTSVDGLREGGVVCSSGGNLRLFRAGELPRDWKPESDTRISVWEILHHMIRQLSDEGESGAGDILAKTSRYSENVRTLAYRLYTLCERKRWAQDANQYNSLILAWDAIEASARVTGISGSQAALFGEEQVNSSPTGELKKKTRKKK